MNSLSDDISMSRSSSKFLKGIKMSASYGNWLDSKQIYFKFLKWLAELVLLSLLKVNLFLINSSSERLKFFFLADFYENKRSLLVFYIRSAEKKVFSNSFFVFWIFNYSISTHFSISPFFFWNVLYGFFVYIHTFCKYLAWNLFFF